MKVLLTATVLSHICQFHKPLVAILHERGCEVHVAARNNLAEKSGLTLDFAEKVFDVPFSRSTKSPDNIKAYCQLKKIIDEENYDVVHCNTPMGGIVTRLAATHARKKGTKVYYTAHGFHFYSGAPIINWSIFYPVEKYFANHYTDKLILISDADYLIAKKIGFRLPTYRIHSVGVNSGKYFVRTDDEIKEMRSLLNLNFGEFICICTGELNKNKNQKRLIAVIPKVLEKVPNFRLLLAGNGPEHDKLKDMIHELGLDETVQLIGYKTNLEDYVSVADVAVSMSIREGLGINLIEAMACGKPVLGSDNRGHREFIKNGENGFIIPDDSDLEIIERLAYLAEDGHARKKMGIVAQSDASKYLDIDVMSELYNIYFKD